LLVSKTGCQYCNLNLDWYEYTCRGIFCNLNSICTIAHSACPVPVSHLIAERSGPACRMPPSGAGFFGNIGKPWQKYGAAARRGGGKPDAL
jgi:hypothetical protein